MLESRSSPVDVALDRLEISIFESNHAPDFHMDFSVHAFHQIGLVLAGNGKIELKEKSQKISMELTKGCLFQIPAGKSHAIHDNSTDPITLQMINYQPTIYEKEPLIAEIFEKFNKYFSRIPVVHIGNSYAYKSIGRIFREMIFESTERRYGYETIMSNLLVRLAVFCNRFDIGAYGNYNSKDRSFWESVQYLRDFFFKSPTVEELSKMAGMSYRSYTAHFKVELGQTVLEYLTNLKLEYAKKRLKESGSIEVAAFDSGFNDLSHFYRIFKKHEKMTPLAYINLSQPTVK